MSDNVTKLRPLPPLPEGKRKKLGLAAAIAILVLLSLYLFREPLNLDAVGRLFRYAGTGASEEFGTYSFDAHSSNSYASWDGGLAVASRSGLRTMDANGRVVCTEDASMLAPALRVGTDALLLFDIGGSHAAVLPKGGTAPIALDVSGSIFDADISSGDTVCIAASESGYKTVLHVYNEKQKETYRWFSSSKFLPLCAVSPDGRMMAAVSYGQKDGAFCCFLNLFRTNRQEPEAEIELGGGLIYDITFLTNDCICLIGEDEIRMVRANGSDVSIFDLQSLYLSDYTTEGDGFVLAALNMYKAGNRCTLTTVGMNGERLASCFVDDEILDIAAAGKYAAVLTTRELILYRRDLTVYARTPNVWMASNVELRPDGTAIVISGNSAQLYIP
ncbi:MAG: hypothetical protein IKC04_08415 [Oscillospiraceae bacterium]|nr:hypothetical protein [Oscillospiraceae bacterium]MBR2897883.1 hypothetical protein [Oscillospiraceae bacterium]MBR2977199.1 hypothetical protein [Oscillospiraceae bacterium]